MTKKARFPWARGRTASVDPSDEKGGPFIALHREVNRLFDDFMHGLDFPGAAAMATVWPQVDVANTDREVTLKAELPGMDGKDVELNLQDGVLTLRGEKKVESGDDQYKERWEGRFERSFHLGPDVDPDKVLASFADGILTITIQKKPVEARTATRIPITR